MKTIRHANSIIAEYAAQGFALTLRQLYYQFVARVLIPNTFRSYKRLGTIISDARLAGLIDWESIQDRTRNLRQNSHWTGPEQIIRSAAAGYRIDKWAHQQSHVEVWIEKDALVGVIEDVCRRNDVAFFSCRGYNSQSEMWVAGQRMIRKMDRHQNGIILHLGDHDPSGMDMTRDIQDRMDLFVGQGRSIEVKRLALNMDQVEEHSPPPNPAKITDSRAQAYIEEYGDNSWELDALEPRVLVDLVDEAIDRIRDEKAWIYATEEEDEGKEQLDRVVTHWHSVLDHLEGEE